jgi:hypothetical protein
MNTNNVISELDREKKARTGGHIYMRFGLKKAIAAAGGEDTYIVGYAGFANSPAELKHGEAQWKFYNLNKKEDFVKAIKKIMADKTFTAASGVTIYIDSQSLLKKYPGYGEFIAMIEKMGGSKVEVEYKPDPEKEKSEKGPSRKKSTDKWGDPDAKVDPAQQQTYRYFTVTSPRLMNQLRRNDRVMQYYRPNRNAFVMGPKEFDAFVKAFGREDIKIVDRFKEEIEETATAGGTSAGGIAGFAVGIGSPDPKKKKKKSETTMIKRQTNEGLAELAGVVDQDHEVQMARADLYKIAKYAIKLHEMLKNVTEAEGIEGWQQAKITKAADYIGSVYHSLDYDMKAPQMETAKTKDIVKRANESTDEYKTSLHNRLDEKAKSKAQQRAAGIALAAKRKGEKPKGKGAAADMSNMSKKDLEKYAGTKHKGLPKKKA